MGRTPPVGGTQGFRCSHDDGRLNSHPLCRFRRGLLGWGFRKRRTCRRPAKLGPRLMEEAGSTIEVDRSDLLAWVCGGH
jgi:hypothetical protein